MVTVLFLWYSGIVNNAAMNFMYKFLFEYLVFNSFDIYPVVKLLSSMVIFCLILGVTYLA